MSADGLRQITHIERVQVAVLVRDDEVHGRQRVPGHGVGAHLQQDLSYGRVPAQVVKAHRAVHGGGCDQARLGRIERTHYDSLATPLEGAQGRGPLIVPNVHGVTCSDEHGLLPMVVDRVGDRRTMVRGQRAALHRSVRFIQGPHLHAFVVAARKRAGPIRADSDAADEPRVRARYDGAAGQALQVPNPQLAVARARDQRGARTPRHGHALDGIQVPVHRLDERFCKHLLHLHRGECTLVFARPLEGVQLRVSIPVVPGDPPVGGYEVPLAPLQHLDLHRGARRRPGPPAPGGGLRPRPPMRS
mmetsp:Transcript_81857/g.250134  ORF Transcript_81857/g.250134 Transcript_81857/m.250134 type:complete len:303 (+) Transcript_81857:585-1493(+)